MKSSWIKISCWLWLVSLQAQSCRDLECVFPRGARHVEWLNSHTCVEVPSWDFQCVCVCVSSQRYRCLFVCVSGKGNDHVWCWLNRILVFSVQNVKLSKTKAVFLTFILTYFIQFNLFIYEAPFIHNVTQSALHENNFNTLKTHGSLHTQITDLTNVKKHPRPVLPGGKCSFIVPET